MPNYLECVVCTQLCTCHTHNYTHVCTPGYCAVQCVYTHLSIPMWTSAVHQQLTSGLCVMLECVYTQLYSCRPTTSSLCTVPVLNLELSSCRLRGQKKLRTLAVCISNLISVIACTRDYCSKSTMAGSYLEKNGILKNTPDPRQQIRY